MSNDVIGGAKVRVPQGGTQIYCPNCESIQICKAINPSSIANESGQRWMRRDHKDINWFRRGRECQQCFHEFLTAELDEDFVTELVKLREALSEIKKNAEEYQKEAAAAAGSLDKLTESLKVLRALSLYKTA